MAIVKAIFTHFLEFLLCAIVTAVPYKGIKAPVIKTVDDDCNLVVELLSDTHLEEKEIIRQMFLKTAFRNFSRASDVVDVVAITGDITNYADEPSLAKYYDIINGFGDLDVITVAGNHDIGHAGDRDKTDISREEARENFIRYRNEYTGRDDDVNYYSTYVNGYMFIILGDEVIDGGHWDAISMTDEELAFLDDSLRMGTREGKPVFVLSHWPLADTNGEETVWPDSGIDPVEEYDLASIFEKYSNVFYITGHMHTGVKAEALDKWYGISSAQKINGVTYLNLPTFGIVNSFGITGPGTGAQLEVYDDEVVFRPRNHLTNFYYANAEYHFELDEAKQIAW